jgi:predicted phage terminase large subunit-like protein
MFLNSKSTVTLAGGAAGSGKALRHGEKVLTDKGWVNIESVSVGDTVITPANCKETITGVYPQGLVDIYRVTFQDGATVDCCGEHLWQYHEARGRGKSRVANTLHLIERMKKGFRPIVPLIDAVDGVKAGSELPIKPYTLGVLLGDGSITTKSVSFTSADVEIFANVLADGYEVKEWNVAEKDRRSLTASCYGVHGIAKNLKEIGLLGKGSFDKYIPFEYLNASVEDKFSLVQGLMDTDGYVDKNGSTEYCTVSVQLAKDMQTILRSLGFTVTISEKQTFFTYKNEKKKGAVAYNLYIRGKNQTRLFRVARKVERTKFKDVGNRIVKIESLEKDYATCISISGEEKLFITTNYIVTHNTFTSLLIALKFMSHPRATGVIFRRTSKMLTAPGSIWHEAVNLYTSLYPDLKIRTRELELVFPNGALLKFSHMQHSVNMYDHKGGQYSLVIFDEATDFEEDMVVYLMSRMRNAYVDYTPQMFLMTNPDYDSFLRHWIQDYYLDETGVPMPERTGHERYFFRQGNTMLWYNSREEAEAVHGKGAESGISSFTFIGATCRDNPPLLKAQPDYISRLMSLPRVERERLLDGSWYARQESAGLFRREWCNIVQHRNGRTKKRVRTWDFAFTKPSESYPNPDWTRGVLMSKDEVTKHYTVEDVVSERDRVHIVEKLVFDTAMRDGVGVTIGIPIDPAAAAGAYAKDLQRRLAEAGYYCKLMKPVKSKITRFAPFASVAQAGFVEVVEAPWNKEFFEELEIFDGEKKNKDDQVDCCSDGILLLNKELQLPSFSLPDLQQNASFGFQRKQTNLSQNTDVSITLPS